MRDKRNTFGYISSQERRLSMDPMSNGITEAMQKFLERYSGNAYAGGVVLIAILVIAVVTMVYSGCKKGSGDDTVTRF
jgi:hypothetical protein